jgi:NAD(P)-dependent dehydrogenase (short-subunit alcohol dehydrogenase family)
MKRTILITGATGTLGREVVSLLHTDGNTLLATHHHLDLDENLRSKLEHVAHVDLSREKETQVTITKLIQHYPETDAAILLAGGYISGSIAETDGNMLDQQFSLNFKTTWHVVRPILEHFKKIGRGQFVFIGAKPAVFPEAGKHLVAYALSKSLLLNLAEIINAEGKAAEITATVIVPSVIDSEQNRKDMPNADYHKWVTATDVAQAIRFILSDAGKKMRQPIYRLFHKA